MLTTGGVILKNNFLMSNYFYANLEKKTQALHLLQYWDNRFWCLLKLFHQNLSRESLSLRGDLLFPNPNHQDRYYCSYTIQWLLHNEGWQSQSQTSLPTPCSIVTSSHRQPSWTQTFLSTWRWSRKGGDRSATGGSWFPKHSYYFYSPILLGQGIRFWKVQQG